MKGRFWAVICNGGYCFTWDLKHLENKRKEKTVKVWAIYPKKKDAIQDCKFRGSSYVQIEWINSKSITY